MSGAQGWWELGQNPKPSRWGSVLANETWRMLSSAWGNIIGEGYAWVEGLGCGEMSGAQGWWELGQNPKLSCWGSVSANEMWGTLKSARENIIGEGYAGLGCCKRAAREVEGNHAKF